MSIRSHTEQDHVEAWPIAEHTDKFVLVGARSCVEIRIAGRHSVRARMARVR